MRHGGAALPFSKALKALPVQMSIFTLLFMFVPMLHVVLMVRGFRGGARIPAWAPFVCLLIWLLQLPLWFMLAAGCMDSECSGPTPTIQAASFFLVFNVAPLIWLARRFSKTSTD